MTDQATLFDTEAPGRIAVDHIHALWRRHGCYASDAAAIIRKATRIANTNPEAAAALIADHDPRVVTYENIPQCAGTGSSRSRADTEQAIAEALADPESIPLLHPEPTLEDCQRLADLTTEQGRCIAWLLNQWPRETIVSQPAQLGQRDGDSGRSIYISSDEVGEVTTTDAWPHAEKTTTSITGATAGQLLAAGRWFIGTALTH